MLYWTTVCEQQFILASCCKIMYAHVTVRNIQLRLIKEFHLYFSNKMFLVSKDKDLRQQCPSSHSIRVTFGSLRFIHSYSTHIFSKKKKTDAIWATGLTQTLPFQRPGALCKIIFLFSFNPLLKHITAETDAKKHSIFSTHFSV